MKNTIAEKGTKMNINFIKERAVKAGYGTFRGSKRQVRKYLRGRIRERVERDWRHVYGGYLVKKINFSWRGDTLQDTFKQEYYFYKSGYTDLPYNKFYIKCFNVSSSFIRKLAEVYMVWPELAEEILECYLVHGLHQFRTFIFITNGSTPISRLKSPDFDRIAFHWIAKERGKEGAMLAVYWFQAYLHPSYKIELHTSDFFKTFKNPYVELDREGLRLVLEIEKNYQERLALRRHKV